MSNINFYVTRSDYQEIAGNDWPSYDDYLRGVPSTNSKIQKEIDDLTQRSLKSGVKFPINTKTACQSKWNWSTIYLNSLSSASCHRVMPTPFELHEFDNFHNLPKKLNDRRLMLSGEWPTGGCEYCKNIEDAGGWSDRQHNLDIRGLTPPELLSDPRAVEVSPSIVEIFAQNTCNLACTYCNAGLSSKIEQENKKFGDFNRNGVKIPIQSAPALADAYFDKFIDWLKRNISTLSRLHLLGGETFIQHELMDSVLGILEQTPCPNLALCIFSNMNVPNKYWDMYIVRIKDLQNRGHIKVFDLTASIDCWGAEQEYARYGLNLNKFEERLSWASEQGDWLRLNCNQTVTALTMKTMPDLINKISQYSKRKHIGHYFQFYTGMQMFQHPQTFAYSLWEETFNRIYTAMPKETVHQLEAIPRMQGLEKQLQTVKTHNYSDIEKLHIYLDELDRRRTTDWRLIFPYLDIHE